MRMIRALMTIPGGPTWPRELMSLALVSAAALCGASASGPALPHGPAIPPGPVVSYGPAVPHQARAYGDLPLAFEANHGQIDRAVEFLARGDGYGIFLTRGRAVLTLHGPGPSTRPAGMRSAGIEMLGARTEGAVLRLDLVGARAPRGSGENRLPGRVNYFVGTDRGRWRTGIPTYARVTYEDVYPGVDVAYYGDEGRLEYDFIVRPGADPALIGLRFSGADHLQVDDRGDLVLRTAAGEVRFEKPRLYQDLEDGRHEVAGAYERKGRKQVGFRVGDYDATRPLVIDPVLVYATYLGGGGEDAPIAIAVDGTGAAYVVGFTRSADFPATSGAFDATRSACYGDVFVTKMDPAGTAVVYSTYLGGTRGSGEACTSLGFGIDVDDSGAAYVTGATLATDFPTTPGAYDVSINGPANAFVTKIDPTGSALAYSTFLGGGFLDIGNAIAVDATGAAYVVGEAQSSNFPTTPGAFSRVWDGPPSGFVTKIAPGGAALAYSTFLGGFVTSPQAIAVDAAGAAYVAGMTTTSEFPVTPGAFDTTHNGGDGGFVTKLDPAGAALVYSTHLGRITCVFLVRCLGLAADGSGSAYVVGATASPAFPTTPGAFDTTFSGGPLDAFVTRLNPSGAALIYSTFLGGSSPDGATAIALDASGAAHVAGWTVSTDFPVTATAIDPTFNGGIDRGDAFAATLDPAGTTLAHATYLGGTDEDAATTLALDASGFAYVAGLTRSTDFPVTPAAFDTTYGSEPDPIGDGFVVRLCAHCGIEIPCLECAADAPGDPVVICHAPPGNVEKRVTLGIAPQALRAHCNHGDTCGACDQDEGPQAGPVSGGTDGRMVE